jgi:hypothetical protein
MPDHGAANERLPDGFEYEVALSFAGEDRLHAATLAACLKAKGVKVFYDVYEEGELWGNDLYAHLHRVYSQQARFCVMFVSRHYAEKLWTTHELRAAQERAFAEGPRQRGYILPVRLDDTVLPGLLATTAYLHISKGVSAICTILAKKVALAYGRPAPPPIAEDAPITKVAPKVDLDDEPQDPSLPPLRQRDARTLKYLLRATPAKSLDYSFQRALDANSIPFEMFYFWESFRSQVERSDFHIYNVKLRDSVQEFYEAWSEGLSFGQYFMPASSGEEYRFVGHIDGRSAELLAANERFQAAVLQAGQRYLAYLRECREAFPELDIEALGRGGLEAFAKYNHS